MNQTALLFAGQGAQIIGMGRDFADRFPAARARFEQANDLLGYDLARLCFEGPEAELTRTEHAQPAIYLVGWIAFEQLRARVPHLDFHATAGLSLGEFTALAAAGAVGFEDGLKLVRTRGRLMQEACEATRGAMAAVLGLDENSLARVCAAADVELANLNCPGQIVISGESAKIEIAGRLAREAGAKKVVPLPVAGAYHSRLMTSARTPLAAALHGVVWRTPAVPVISNVTGRAHGALEEMKARLVEQVTAPVRWEAGVRHLLEQGFARFVELGPGRALAGFMKRIEPGVRVWSVADPAGLEETAAAW